ncbi:hypothetical protein ACFCYN_24055 [Gottfriedia sp. NPDC056225]|uniref:hypothetical protein n=1 Tax=Gottfriedia sp. NPDC056225 TaxID=3345751 RepID=UPI0035E2A22C
MKKLYYACVMTVTGLINLGYIIFGFNTDVWWIRFILSTSKILFLLSAIRYFAKEDAIPTEE